MKASEDSTIKILMEQMASQAALKTLLTTNPVLPPGWVLLKSFAGKPLPPSVPVQGFIAAGPINENLDIAIVISLGIAWENFYKLNWTGVPQPPTNMARLSSAVAGKEEPNDAMISSVFQLAYNGSRKAIWDALAFIPQDYQDAPVYFTGMWLGAPMAQICALDMRTGNTGPDKQAGPSTPGPGYVFSAPNFANTSFATYYNALVASKALTPQYVVWAATPSLTVDFFPVSDNTDYEQAGELIYIDNIKLPQYDVPWWERSNVYYLQSLGGQPTQNIPVPASFSNLPAGFSQQLAFTASQVVAAAYQLAQRPNGSTPITNTNFSLSQTIDINGTAWAAIYTSNNTVIVGIRGPVNFDEYYTFSCLSTTSPVSFISSTTAQVHTGAYTIYTSPLQDSTGNTFSQALISALTTLAAGKSLVVAGHDLGGAIASIAATDYALSNYGFKPASLYTFGSTLFANSFFVDSFTSAVGAQSYQLYRLNDKMANPLLPLGYLPVGNAITISGQLVVEESTYHSIAGYCNLLDTSA
ncbi:lipase family protein [Mucilaginibacter sp. KACC 22063]|uniref:lipase family protein n=1 Tax=Mucilaginibacter sp. KACC 22063 TaxID=3025666 RepID=UPI002365B1B3|nr:hypothetical protein [Mucilaginibacter sp. KACC 22063]WDF57256.1 hypothetical protein PQ461_09345 [Mucilaginibacter sp. KACC 22063]